MNIAKIIGNGLKTGLVMAASTTAVIMLASGREQGDPWAAINAIAHVVDGDEREQPQHYAPRESTLGIAVNGTAMCAWGVLYEGALQVTGTRPRLWTAALAVAAAWVIDYKIVPRQYTPGIEKRLSPPAVGAAYAAMLVAFALSPRWNPSA